MIEQISTIAMIAFGIAGTAGSFALLGWLSRNQPSRPDIGRV